jgi:hypothetical protein
LYANASGYAHECRDFDSHPDEYRDANEHSNCDQYGDANEYADCDGYANRYGNAGIHAYEHRNANQYANGRSLSIHYGL